VHRAADLSRGIAGQYDADKAVAKKTDGSERRSFKRRSGRAVSATGEGKVAAKTPIRMPCSILVAVRMMRAYLGLARGGFFRGRRLFMLQVEQAAASEIQVWHDEQPMVAVRW
jgi:hypothetical protein